MSNRNRSRWHRTLRRCWQHVAAYARRKGRLWLWFVAALAGVLAKGFFEAVQAGQPYRLSWTRFIVALVATLVIFRTIYEQYKNVRASVPLLVQVSVAFLAGFTWQTVFEELTAAK